jgi:hypothetical protein
LLAVSLRRNGVGMRLRRWLSVGTAVVLASVALSSPALAAPPDPSAVSVSATELSPGQVFTVSFELYNPADFTVTAAKAQLRLLEASMSDVFDLVSCTGTVDPCGPLGSSFRGPVGDLPPTEGRTVVFTLQVKDSAPNGSYTLEHQFVGGNFAFAAGTGPVLTVSSAADLAVSLDASARGVLVSRITYTVRVANLGPADATGVRVGGSYAAGLSWAGGSGCVRTMGRSVQCDFAAIPAGGSASATFSVDAGLLAIGSFTTQVSRVSSSPSDPVSANDSAHRSCTALTGLLVRC